MVAESRSLLSVSGREGEARDWRPGRAPSVERRLDWEGPHRAPLHRIALEARPLPHRAAAARGQLLTHRRRRITPLLLADSSSCNGASAARTPPRPSARVKGLGCHARDTGDGERPRWDYGGDGVVEL